MAEDNWRDRSKGMSCATCVYYVVKERHSEGAEYDPETPIQIILGRCRRHAPTMNGWPVMFPSDWCGDHKLDENKV